MRRPMVFFLWACLALPATGLPATLEGVVSDGVTGTKLGGVQVACESDGRTQDTITDSQGRYRFEGLKEKKRAVLLFDKVGYVPSPDEEAVTLRGSRSRLDRVLFKSDGDNAYYRDLGKYIASLQGLSGSPRESEFVAKLGLPEEAVKIVQEQLDTVERDEFHVRKLEAARRTCLEALASDSDLLEITADEEEGRIVIRGMIKDRHGKSKPIECVALEGEDGSWAASLRWPGSEKP